MEKVKHKSQDLIKAIFFCCCDTTCNVSTIARFTGLDRTSLRRWCILLHDLKILNKVRSGYTLEPYLAYKLYKDGDKFLKQQGVE